MLKNGRKTNQYLILGGVDNQMTIFEFLVYLFQSFDTLPIHFIDWNKNVYRPPFMPIAIAIADVFS